MSSQGNRMVVVLAVLGAILLGALAYMLVIRPELEAAALAEEDRALAEADNELIEAQISALEALVPEVEGWEADIAAVAAQIPGLPETSQVGSVVITAADDADVPFISMGVTSLALVEATAVTDTAQPSEDVASEDSGLEDDGTEDGSSGEAVDETAGTEDAVEPVSTSPAVEGLVAVQLQVSTEGDATSMLEFLNGLHSQQTRYLTIVGFNAQQAEDTDAQPGRPALSKGDWILDVQLMAFSLIDPDNPVEVDESGSVPAFEGKIDNPFAPLE